jgi:hypothetical protein
MALNLQEMMRRQKLRRITTWFTTPSQYDSAPVDYVTIAVEQFLDDCRSLGLRLCIGKGQFLRAMCKVICQMYEYRHEEDMYARLDSLKKIPKPEKWTTAYEMKWIEYLDYNFFDSAYWERFWKTIPESKIDSDVRFWRQELEGRMPRFITRNIDLLLDDGMLYEDEDGNIVSAADEAEDCVDEHEYS